MVRKYVYWPCRSATAAIKERKTVLKITAGTVLSSVWTHVLQLSAWTLMLHKHMRLLQFPTSWQIDILVACCMIRVRFFHIWIIDRIIYICLMKIIPIKEKNQPDTWFLKTCTFRNPQDESCTSHLDGNVTMLRFKIEWATLKQLNGYNNSAFGRIYTYHGRTDETSSIPCPHQKTQATTSKLNPREAPINRSYSRHRYKRTAPDFLR